MLISAVIGHLVGDFLFQNDYQALNKKKSKRICAIHCAIWTITVWLFAWWPAWTLVPLFITHFAQDHTQFIVNYMRVVGQQQFATGPLSPWSIVVVDQVFHLLTLWIIWQFV